MGAFSQAVKQFENQYAWMDVRDSLAWRGLEASLAEQIEKIEAPQEKEEARLMAAATLLVQEDFLSAERFIVALDLDTLLEGQPVERQNNCLAQIITLSSQVQAFNESSDGSKAFLRNQVNERLAGLWSRWGRSYLPDRLEDPEDRISLLKADFARIQMAYYNGHTDSVIGDFYEWRTQAAQEAPQLLVELSPFTFNLQTQRERKVERGLRHLEAYIISYGMTQTRDEARGEIAHDSLFRRKDNFDVAYLESSLSLLRGYLVSLPPEDLPSSLEEALEQYQDSSEEGQRRAVYINRFIASQHLGGTLQGLETLENDSDVAAAGQDLRILLDRDSAYWFGEGRFDRSLQYSATGLAHRAEGEALSLQLAELSRTVPLDESFGRDLRSTFSRESAAEFAALVGISMAAAWSLGLFQYLGRRSAAYTIANTVNRMPGAARYRGSLSLIPRTIYSGASAPAANGLTLLQSMEASNYLGLRLATGETTAAFAAGSVTNAAIVNDLSNVAFDSKTGFAPTLYDLSALHLIMSMTNVRSLPGIEGAIARGLFAGPVMTGAAVTREPLDLAYEGEDPLSFGGILHSAFMGFALETGTHAGLSTLAWGSRLMRPTHGYQEGGPKSFFDQIPEFFGSAREWPGKINRLGKTLGNMFNWPLLDKRIRRVIEIEGAGQPIGYWQYLFSALSMATTVIVWDFNNFGKETNTSAPKKNFLRILQEPSSMVAPTGFEVVDVIVYMLHLMQTDHRQAAWDFLEKMMFDEGREAIELLRDVSQEAAKGDPEALKYFATAENPDYPARLAEWSQGFLDWLDGKVGKEAFEGMARKGVRTYESTLFDKSGNPVELRKAFTIPSGYLHYASLFPNSFWGGLKTLLQERRGIRVVESDGSSVRLPKFKKQVKQKSLDDPELHDLSKHAVNVDGPTLMQFSEKLASLLPAA